MLSFFLVLLAGCGKEEADFSQARVEVVLSPGGVGDQGYNDQILRGLQTAAVRYGFTLAVHIPEEKEQGIQISTAVQDIASLKTMDALEGMKGYSIYYHTLPDNEVNDWFVEEHKKRFEGEVPDLFTSGGMTAAMSIVEALKKTDGDTDAEKLIETMEGMEFDSPKGKMKFRADDHQAMQPLYSITLEKQEGVDHLVPVLERELGMDETEPPVRNKK